MRCSPVLLLSAVACAPAPEGLRRTPDGPGPVVRVDWDAEPLPDIPFPTDLATRPDPTSPTGLRPNLPERADVRLETLSRQRINRLSGFGTFAPIQVGFEGRLDLDELRRRHPGDPLGPAAYRDDAVLLIDVTPGSPTFGRPAPLDFGQGRFPQDATRLGRFLPNDPRQDEPSLLFETGEEDLDGDGLLDPGEDTDGDGLLDHPNVWPPGGDPRADLLTWYDLQTDTLILRPVVPLREATTYAVVLTDALVDEDGAPIRSPWAWVNHTRQTPALEPVVGALEDLGRSVDEVAFAWTFTTGAQTRELWDLAEGVRGRGPFAALADRFPAGVVEAHELHANGGEPLFLPVEDVVGPLSQLGLFPEASVDFVGDAYTGFSSGVVGGAFVAADLLYDRDDHGLDDSDEIFDVDPVTGRVAAAPRRITFTCMLPKAGAGFEPPWPVVVHMHGYGSTRLEQVAFDYALNRMGMAVCGIDAHGHGIALSSSDEELVASLLELTGTQPLWWHLLDDRLRDLDNDGDFDPAGDMFGADPFHTRDMIRQPVLDAVQLVESLRRCGEGEMEVVLPTAVGNLPTGASRVSCDWDGDGRPDLGGPDLEVRLHGVSMGGIMTSLAAAVQETEVAVVTVPGGGLADVSGRTDITAVSDAMVGRALSPLIVGEPQPDGSLRLEQVVISVDRQVRLPVGALPSVPAGGTVVVRNLDLGHEEEGLVPADGRFRVPIAANALDAGEKQLLAGIPPEGVAPGVVYEVPDPSALGDRLVVEVRDARGATIATFDALPEDVVHEGVTTRAGAPLVAGSWGLGLRRGSADLRRTVGVLALAIEAADPILYARRWAEEPFADPRDVLIHLTTGDTTVPIAAGLALARAAGLVDYTEVDPRYGATVDDWLVRTGTTHGMEEFGPWTGPGGGPILFDPDDLDLGTDGTGAPSEAPLRVSREVGGARHALRFLYVDDNGSHAYLVPDESLAFDWNLFGAQQMARFLETGAVEDDPCLATRDCPFLRPFPEAP